MNGKNHVTLTAVSVAIIALAVTITAFQTQDERSPAEMKRALVVIDVQKVYFEGGFKLTYPEGSLENIAAAMDAAHADGIPIVVVQHHSRSASGSFKRGSELWQLKEEIADKPRSVLIEKSFPGSFTETGLEKWLRDNEITTVTICGYMTQMCCDSTARQAYHMGFEVEFLSDATGTKAFENEAGKVTAEELHRATLVAQASAFSKVMTTKEWIDSLK
jgi:nicotinamidase-related amidase